jgi:hypothetical protein
MKNIFIALIIGIVASIIVVVPIIIFSAIHCIAVDLTIARFIK